MPGHRGLQQGLLGAQPAGRTILCHEGHAQAVHLRESEGEHRGELEGHLRAAKPSLRGQTQPLFLNPPLRVLRAGM